jgi:CBS domain-containing protein
MTRNVQFVTPQENLQRAAQMMDELNVGSLPVCDGDHLIGMVTDRDITVRATAAGRAPGEARVEEVMSGDVRWCFEDQSLDEVMQQMADSQIRRVPVVSHDEQHKLVGIVALGDIVTKTGQGAQGNQSDQLVEKISTPSEPDRSQQGNATTASAEAPSRDTGAQGYEGDVGLAGAAGATSGSMSDTEEPESGTGGLSSTGGTSGTSIGSAGTRGGALGGDLG